MNAIISSHSNNNAIESKKYEYYNDDVVNITFLRTCRTKNLLFTVVDVAFFSQFILVCCCFFCRRAQRVWEDNLILINSVCFLVTGTPNIKCQLQSQLYLLFIYLLRLFSHFYYKNGIPYSNDINNDKYCLIHLFDD